MANYAFFWAEFLANNSDANNAYHGQSGKGRSVHSMQNQCLIAGRSGSGKSCETEILFLYSFNSSEVKLHFKNMKEINASKYPNLNYHLLHDHSKAFTKGVRLIAAILSKVSWIALFNRNLLQISSWLYWAFGTDQLYTTWVVWQNGLYVILPRILSDLISI